MFGFVLKYRIWLGKGLVKSIQSSAVKYPLDIDQPIDNNQGFSIIHRVSVGSSGVLKICPLQIAEVIARKIPKRELWAQKKNRPNFTITLVH